jgi:lysophospholipase L1-like esterase
MILGLGANDMLRGISPTETEKNLEKIIQISKKKYRCNFSSNDRSNNSRI